MNHAGYIFLFFSSVIVLIICQIIFVVVDSSFDHKESFVQVSPLEKAVAGLCHWKCLVLGPMGISGSENPITSNQATQTQHQRKSKNQSQQNKPCVK